MPMSHWRPARGSASSAVVPCSPEAATWAAARDSTSSVFSRSAGSTYPTTRFCAAPARAVWPTTWVMKSASADLTLATPMDELVDDRPSELLDRRVGFAERRPMLIQDNVLLQPVVPARGGHGRRTREGRRYQRDEGAENDSVPHRDPLLVAMAWLSRRPRILSWWNPRAHPGLRSRETLQR